MNNQLNKIKFLNSRLIQILLGSFVIGLPIFVTLEAKADMREAMPNREMKPEKNTVPESGTYNTPVYNDTDGGYDGEPIANVIPTDGTVNVKLINNTNAAIDYQAIGYTENQTLEGGEKHTMINLPLPVVIRSARQDDGFIKFLPLKNEAQDGVLEVSLDEDPDFYDDDNLGVIRIEEDGSVYLN